MSARRINTWRDALLNNQSRRLATLLEKYPELAFTPVTCAIQNTPPRLLSPLYIACVVHQNLDTTRLLVEAGTLIQNSSLGNHFPGPDPRINRYLIDHGIDVNRAAPGSFHPADNADIETFIAMITHGLDPRYAWQGC